MNEDRALARALRAAAAVAAAAAVVGLLPGAAGRAGTAVMAATLIAAPLGRVLWLAVEWWREGDRRYALTAAGLLLLVGAGAALALAGR